MAQPPTYNRSFSFSSYQTANPTTPLPGNSLDVELSAVKATLDPILANLALIQNDDGTVKNGSIGAAQLSSALTAGFSTPTVWATATVYAINAAVFHGSAFYRCAIAHTSGVFATDLAAAKWVLTVDLSTIPLVAASQIAVTASGSLTTDVQGSLQALDSGKAATSHTHTASAISDSTAAGRAMLKAADVTAQTALLGLGSLAFLSAVPATTTLASFVDLTGIISPAISSNQNDWSPTGLATASVVRINPSNTVNVTGMAAQANGTILEIQNIATGFSVTLTAQDASSGSANRFLFPYTVTLRPLQSIFIQYDSTATAWRPMSQLPASPIAAGFKNLKVTNGGSVDQMVITADAITLEDTFGAAVRVSSVSVTVSDLTLGAANGLDTGSVAISTWYSLWVIYNPVTNTTAALMSASATAPTMPSGYTFKARVGWGRTDTTASPNCKFLNTIQYGRRAQYIVGTLPAVMPNIANGTAGTWANLSPTLVTASVTSVVPTTASRIFIVPVGTYKNGDNSLLVAPNTAYGGTNNGPGGSNGQVYAFAGIQNVTSSAARVCEFTLEGTTIAWASGGAGGAISCLGWEDNI